jgi:arsenite-transporting ATPase
METENPMEFLKLPTRNVFFTGKGGVGKTSVACATAVQLADAGRRVLLVSTDPASNLDEVLGTALGHQPTIIASVPNLFAMNLDPEQSAADYRERMIGPYRALLPAAAIASMEEQFSGSCTMEIAAFDEFSRLLGDVAATSQFDHVIFDTAPTGHTLRLLTLPSAWSGFLQSNTTGVSCLGPLAGLQAQQALYEATVQALSDPQKTTLIMVTRADTAAFREAARTSGELKSLGVQNQHLVINAVFRAVDVSDPIAMAMQSRGEQAIVEMPEALRALPRTDIPLCAGGVLGVATLRQLGRKSTTQGAESRLPMDFSGNYDWTMLPPSPAALIDELARPGHGVILAMGKGGVGKTTVAAAVAVALAERGFRVHLSTTDPAAHILAALAGETLTGLTISRIDPAVETARYASEVMLKAGAGLDDAGKALLAEDLRSPCTEEIAVFRAFAEAVAEGTNRFVVLDTAPTGHTVLLLDSALAYHREVTRQSSGIPEQVQQLLPRLRDPEFTRVLIVTLPEATPVHEAGQLQSDLRRAGIEPFAWIINQSLAPLKVTDLLLRQRQGEEFRYIKEVITQYAQRTAVIAWQLAPPIGRAALNRAIGVDHEGCSEAAEVIPQTGEI